MVKKILIYTFILLISVFLTQKSQADLSAQQTVSAVLSRGGGTTPTGGIIAGSVVGGSAVSGATALAFAPIILAGLEPNATVCAAAPLDCINKPRQNYLQLAIKEHTCPKLLNKDLISTKDKFYFAQDDCNIINGSYDVDVVKLPVDFFKSSKIKINVTIASEPYGSFDGKPNFTLGIYKDITRLNLNKKFETQQFLHHYLMKKYEIPLKITSISYSKSLQKLSGIIKTSEIENKDLPLNVVVRFTYGGFKMGLRKQIPKVITYAYLIEFAK